MIKELGLAYYRLPVEEDVVFLSSVFDVVYVLQSSVVPAVASPNAVGFKALLSSCFPL